MEIIMQYPEIERNRLCDGKHHIVKPSDLWKFTYNGNELYLFQYVDKKYNAKSFTVLRKDGDQFFKVPLYDYQALKEKIKNNEIVLTSVDLSMLEDVDIIHADKPINNLDAFKSPSKDADDAIMFERREKISLAYKKIFDAMIIRYGCEESFPKVVSDFFDNIDSIDVSSLSKPNFDTFVSYLQKNLDACVTQTDSFFAPNVDILRADYFAKSIIDSFKLNRQNAAKPVVAPSSPPPPPPPSPPTPPKHQQVNKKVKLEKEKKSKEIPVYVAINPETKSVTNQTFAFFEADHSSKMNHKLGFSHMKNSNLLTLLITKQLYNSQLKSGIFSDTIEVKHFNKTYVFNIAMCDSKEKFDELSKGEFEVINPAGGSLEQYGDSKVFRAGVTGIMDVVSKDGHFFTSSLNDEEPTVEESNARRR